VFKRLVAGTAWSLVGTLAARGSSFVAMTLAARILGPENYGQFAIVQSLGATAGTVAGSVFGVAATRFLARDIDRDKSRATRIFAIVELAALAVGGVLALAMIVGAPWIAQAIYGQQALAGVIRLSALLLLTNCVASAQIGAFIGLSEFRAYALLSSWQVPLIILATPAGAMLGGFTGALGGLLLSQVGACAAAAFMLRRLMRRRGLQPAWRGAGTEWATIRGFLALALIGSGLSEPSSWLASLILMRNAGPTEVAYLHATNQWLYILGLIPGLVSQVALPLFSQMSAQQMREDIIRLVRRASALNALATIPAAVIVMLLTRQIMAIYGAEFAPGARVLAIAALTSCLISQCGVLSQVIVAYGKMREGIVLNAIWAACYLTLAWQLVHLGAYGLSGARAMAFTLHLVLSILLVRRLVAARAEPGATS
jgi:O-antigen/teichoic acid export membrane protein